MDALYHPGYDDAFRHYLRRGTPIALSLKAEDARETTHYIWRTARDGKVRPSHAANEGRVFAWDAPPPTGRPGEDFNCRCWAEPYAAEVAESAFQDVTGIVDEALDRWSWHDFVAHFFLGNGKDVRLSHVGHLQDVIDRARDHVFKRVETQVFNQARQVLTGSLSDTFSNSYDFSTISFIHGGSIVHGDFEGDVVRAGKVLHIDLTVSYNFFDYFTDPLGIRERNRGTSDPSRIPAGEPVEGELGGKYYKIFDSWETRLTATIHIDPARSDYR